MPKSWLPLLDQGLPLVDGGFENILYPTEWVGYESEKDIIFAQVAYPILSDEITSLKAVSKVHLEYKIFVKDGDFEGKVVSCWELFKFSDRCKLNEKQETFSTDDIKQINLMEIRVLSDDVQKVAKKRLTMFYDNITIKIRSCQAASRLSQHGGGIIQCSDQSHYQKRKILKPKPNKDIGCTWMKQAEIDFATLNHIHTHVPSSDSLGYYGLVCFLSQQVAEKAMTGAIFSLCGEDNRNLTAHHNLIWRAKTLHLHMIDREEVTSLDDDLKDLMKIAKALQSNGYYNKTRYPNKWDGNIVPSLEYDENIAQNAVTKAKRVLDIVKNYMPNVN